MSARINNFPAYVVYDRSFSSTNTITGTLLNGITGEEGFIRDGDLSTAYEINTAGGLLESQEVYYTIDYGKVLMNIQLSYKIGFAYNRNGGTGNAQWDIEYSQDDITYTTIDSGSVTANGGIELHTGSQTYLSARYVRVHILTPSTGNPSNSKTYIYELRLMGSG